MIKAQFKKSGLITLTLLLCGTSAWAQGEEGFTLRSLPLLVVYGGTILLVVASIRIGFALGKRKFDELGAKVDSMVTPVSGALMGLLAFILAFTFNVSMSRFETRKALYIDQVNVIENCFRRADLLPDKYRIKIQNNMIGNTNIRVGTIGHPERLKPAVAQLDTLRDRLWEQLEEMSRDSTVSAATLSLMANAMSELMVVHNKRVTITQIYHLPAALWAALYGLVILAMMSMGYNFGMTTKINWTLVIIMSFSFSAVIILISDLDRSGTGVQSIIKFNQQGMLDLQARLRELSH